MNTSTTTRLIAALSLSLAAAAPVLAQEATPDTWLSSFQSTKTRAQVNAELATARADGTIKSGSTGYIEKVAVSQPREAVREATRRAMASGEIAAINREAYDVPAAQGTAKRSAGTSVAAR